MIYINFDIYLQLSEIKECGNMQEFFFLKIGRLAATGCGVLWMKTDDPFIAQNMSKIVSV